MNGYLGFRQRWLYPLAIAVAITSCTKSATPPPPASEISGISKPVMDPNVSPRDVDVKIAWDYQKFPGRVRLYAVKPESRFDVSQTRIVSSLKGAPVTEPLDDTLRMKTGTNVSFALTIKNPVKQDLYFFASPHLVHPTEAAVKHRFECLCNHKVYRLPPGKIWYRIVRLDLEKGFDKPALELKHTIVGLTAAEVEASYSEALYEKD